MELEHTYNMVWVEWKALAVWLLKEGGGSDVSGPQSWHVCGRSDLDVAVMAAKGWGQNGCTPAATEQWQWGQGACKPLPGEGAIIWSQHWPYCLSPSSAEWRSVAAQLQDAKAGVPPLRPLPLSPRICSRLASSLPKLGCSFPRCSATCRKRQSMGRTPSPMVRTCTRANVHCNTDSLSSGQDIKAKLCRNLARCTTESSVLRGGRTGWTFLQRTEGAHNSPQEILHRNCLPHCRK